MPRAYLTVRMVAAVPAPLAGQTELFDKKVTGLSLRVGKSGRRSWNVLYRVRGSRIKRRVRVGTFPEMELKEARAEAVRVLRGVFDGEDPAATMQAAKAAPTLRELVDLFVSHHLGMDPKAAGDRETRDAQFAKAKLRSAREYERLLRKELVGTWGHRKAADISRRDVIALLDSIAARPAPIMANRVLAVTRKLFNWGIGRDLIKSNPCVAVTRAGKERRRDRTLTDTEIRAFWFGLDRAKINPNLRTALRLVLITAQRPGEVAGMEWVELDRKGAWWVIPAARAKNGLAHRVPLTPLALELLARVPRKVQQGTVFPSAGKKTRSITANALAHGLARLRKLDGFAVTHFTAHDLRRTAATGMTGAGVSRVVVGKLLNHAELSITATYDRNAYDSDKRRALETWEGALRQALAEPKAGEVAA